MIFSVLHLRLYTLSPSLITYILLSLIFLVQKLREYWKFSIKLWFCSPRVLVLAYTYAVSILISSPFLFLLSSSGVNLSLIFVVLLCVYVYFLISYSLFLIHLSSRVHYLYAWRFYSITPISYLLFVSYQADCSCI